MIDSTALDTPTDVEVIVKDIVLGSHTFRVYVAGTGQPVLMLHGFPDSAALWRYVAPSLVAAGYQVIAPDLRGFGESSKPQDAAEYVPTKLLADVVGIMQALGVRRAHVVAHDFGAFLGWMLAALTPRRVDHLVVISVGHPSVWIHPSLEQRARFWYSILYMMPEAEDLVRHRNWELAREMLADEHDGAQYLASLKRPGALTAGLNWYRANCNPAAELHGQRQLPPVGVPVLAMWGAGDQAMTEQTMLESRKYVHGPWRYERIEKAGHFVPLDAPDEVSGLVLEWLGSQETVETLSKARTRFARR